MKILKPGFHFGISLTFFTLFGFFTLPTTLEKTYWLVIVPLISILVFIPDILDYCIYGFLAHHPWTHHPITLAYFFPLVAIFTVLGIDLFFLQLLWFGWFLHLLLDAGGLGLPLLWEGVRVNQPLRSYSYPVPNTRWVLFSSQKWFESFNWPKWIWQNLYLFCTYF
ncbi:MAG: hypothetical protein ACFFBD_28145, partial [Candidatus Hodarchaeota archaeon]